MASVFETDRLRQRLAEEGEIDKLRRTYLDEENFVNLPSMNSPKKWDFHAANSTTSQHPITKRRIKSTVSLIDTSKKVLDLGVGYGDIIPELLEKSPSLDFVGVDFSPGMVKRLRDAYPWIPFFLSSMNIKKGMKFDQILALEVLEHIPVPDLPGFFLEVNRLLSPDGRFIISVPLNENLEWITYVCSHCGNLENVNGHVRSYSPALIRKEMEVFGFEVLREIPVFVGENNQGAMVNLILETRRMK